MRKLALFLLVFLYSFPAGAQQGLSCGPRTAVMEFLLKTYNERIVAAGIIDNKTIVEITASDKGRWTMLATTNKGLTCLIVVGESWQMEKPKD